MFWPKSKEKCPEVLYVLPTYVDRRPLFQTLLIINYTPLFFKNKHTLLKSTKMTKKYKKLGGLIRQISRAWNKYLKGTSSEIFLKHKVKLRHRKLRKKIYSPMPNCKKSDHKVGLVKFVLILKKKWSFLDQTYKSRV